MSTFSAVAPPPERWTWSPFEDDAWPHLAQFVVDRQELPLRARDLAHRGADNPARQEVLQDLWSLFADLRIPYQAPAWVAEQSQDIRDPHLVLEEGGTCLDLVLMFAAMSLSAGLRPYLVVDPANTEQAGHAMIAVDLEQGPDEESTLDSITGQTGWGLVEPGPLRIQVEGERLVLLDCTHAAAPSEQEDDADERTNPRGVRELSQAAAGAGAFFTHEPTGAIEGWATRTIAVVDVSGTLRSSSLRPYSVDKSRRPAITTSVPEAPTWVGYPSRERLIVDILPRLIASRAASQSPHGAGDTAPVTPGGTGIMLFGDPGIGKSRLAHELATRSGRAAAWWLTANDDRTLRRSLASASARESGRPLPETDLGRDEEADAGLARLAENRLPWLVVLDNANCGPTDLKSRPRPRADLGQCLIVTTLPEFAQAWAAALSDSTDPGDVTRVGFEVAALTDDDLSAAGSTLSDAARDAAAGSALLVRAYEALARSHPADFEAVMASEPGQGAVRLWNVFRRLEPASVDAATQAAWLPPDGMPAELLGPMGPRLIETGLLTRSLARSSLRPLFDLHRTIGAAARETDTNPVQHALAIVDDAASRAHVDRFGDSATLDQLATALIAAHDEDPAQQGLGSALLRLATLLEAFGRVVAKAGRRPGQGWSAEDLLTVAQRRMDLAPLELADCLHGLARAVNQDVSRNTPITAESNQETPEEEAARQAKNAQLLGVIEAALGMVTQARELRRDVPLLVARTEALRGLLMQKQARFLSGAPRLELLRQAYDLLTWSQREREHIIHEQRRAAGVPEDRLDEDPELARAAYNLAGAANSLAAALPPEDQESRLRYLDESGAVYERVRDLRMKIYGSARPHPHILSCVRGLGLNKYQRAWLLTSHAEVKLAQLRDATGHLVRVLVDDEKLDYEDGTDTAKTLALLQKVSEMRLALSEKGDPDATHRQAVSERARIRTN